MATPPPVVVCGGFDDIKSRDLRFLEEAAKLGELTLLLWPDPAIRQVTGQPPKFPLAERLYFLNAVRYVSRVIPCDTSCAPDSLPKVPDLKPAVWADVDANANPAREKFCRENKIGYRVFTADALNDFPEPPPALPTPGRKKVVVTGCYDWLHSGHVRFFEEASAYGDLYVIVGHDANLRLLKGEGHPLLPQKERRYLAGSIRFVKQALISSGEGWMDAAPEIARLRPDIYAVNEDGDQGGKREFCLAHGIEYLVLKRAPAPGLPRRTSTDLRGY